MFLLVETKLKIEKQLTSIIAVLNEPLDIDN